MLALVLSVTVGCDSGDGKDEKVAEDTQATADVAAMPETTADTGLPICPDETKLAGTDLLPCNCYGTVATDPDAQVPGCKTQVVCCPAIQNLRCEDHELLKDILSDADQDVSADVSVNPDTAVQKEVVPEVVEETIEVPVCPFEVALDNYTPCTCKGTLVDNVKHALPDCTKKVVCCPSKGVICE